MFARPTREKEELAQVCHGQQSRLGRLEGERQEWQRKIIEAEREKRDIMEKADQERQRLERQRKEAERLQQEAAAADRRRGEAEERFAKEVEKLEADKKGMVVSEKRTKFCLNSRQNFVEFLLPTCRTALTPWRRSSNSSSSSSSSSSSNR